MIIKLLVDAGDMKPGPALSQKLGPAGINIGKVMQEINEKTESFRGIKVPVELDVDTKKKDFSIKVFSPPVAELLKKELGIEKGSGQPQKIKVANAAIEQIVSVAKTKMPGMLCKEFKSAVKSVVGSCVSLGVLIENENPKEIEKEIDKGIYGNEIKNQITILSPEKKARLDKFFTDVKAKQEEMLKKEEVEKAAEEAAKAEKVAEAAATAAPAEAGKEKAATAETAKIEKKPAEKPKK